MEGHFIAYCKHFDEKWYIFNDSIVNKYDISKTEVYPVYIEGVAGKTYEINIEFRASDGLRWNYPVDVDKFSISNSENLGSDSFKYTAERGFKNGQAIIHVTQYKVSSGNILTITYNNDNINLRILLPFVIFVHFFLFAMFFTIFFFG